MKRNGITGPDFKMLLIMSAKRLHKQKKGFTVKTVNPLLFELLLVGETRFELATPCAQDRCATRLRYSPTT